MHQFHRWQICRSLNASYGPSLLTGADRETQEFDADVLQLGDAIGKNGLRNLSLIHIFFLKYFGASGVKVARPPPGCINMR